MYLSEEDIRATAHLSSRVAAKMLGCGKSSVNKYRTIYSSMPEPIQLPDAKVLILDIESRPGMYYSWGPKAEWLSPDKMIDPGGLMCFAAKWLGAEYEVEFYRGPNAVVEAHRLLSEADLVVTYNGDRYDLKRLNNEFLRNGMAPPKPYKSIDLIKTNRGRFDLPYKNLDTLAQTLGVGSKFKHQGFDLWLDCMRDDPEAWATMQIYNTQDVLLTESVYVKLLPWLTNAPHMGMFTYEGRGLCPYCGQSVMHERGETGALVNKYALYQCDNCEGWARGNKPTNTDKLTTRRV